MTTFPREYIEKLNKDTEHFPQVKSIEPDYHITRKGVGQLVMLDRYAFKDTEKKTLAVGDFVVVTAKEDPKFPARGLGWIESLNDDGTADVRLLDEYVAQADDAVDGIIRRSLNLIDKPLEIFYEQIAYRVARGLAAVETDEKKREQAFNDFYREIVSDNFVPAGRVLYGAGSGQMVTFYNCYVMPMPKDSREGIAEHRGKVMEIMSRGGGVGTNGSTLRPRHAIARGVNGRSSGAVSWLNDIAQLTHLVEQGGSRRGAQMIMLADWHPDIIEFIISKMQNPKILRFIADNFADEEIRRHAKAKLKFTPLTDDEREIYEQALLRLDPGSSAFKKAQQILEDGGKYSVNNPEFLTGANISVAITHEFMNAVERGDEYELRFPDIENYTPDQMAEYNEKWHEVGDVREWHLPVKVYRKINAQELWQLICFCATYSAEPGIFFIDNANDMTNAKAYGQKVVATNPCFTGDMRLLTTEGYKTFEELSQSHEPISIINKDGNISIGTVWCSGEKEVVEVRLGNGSRITCTEDHVFLTNHGEQVRAIDLKGKRLMPYLKETKFIDRIYELFGFIQGDGNLSRLRSPSHLGIEVNVGKGDLEIRYLFKKTFSTGYEDDRTIYVTGLNDMLRKLGFSDSTLPEREFPSSYNEWSLNEKRSFLRGCYSANGSVLDAGRVTYKTTCKKFAEQLLSTLENDFGIKGYITVNKPKDVAFSNGTYTCRESYDVNIANFDGLQKFYNEIGFIHRYKMFKLRAVLIERAPKVVNVIKTGEKRKVYDFTEPLTHWGVVEGFVVHNCGEQPLAPYSVCNLAAVNLANMADKANKTVDWAKLKRTVAVGVRMQDNVIDATPYFLEENRKQALGERRIGLGVMGLHDLLLYCGLTYGSAAANALVDKVFETIATTAYRTSIELAKEKGSFPFLGDINGRHKFVWSGYMREMPHDIRQGVMRYGIRNSHLLTVAPTGSTGTMIGVSTGLEPYFSFKYYRSGRLGKFIEVNADIVEELGLDGNNLPDYFVSAMDLTPEQHADTQCVIQRWVDSSISKTVNAPRGYSVEQVQRIYERLYRGGAKGGTVYVDGSRDAQVLSLTAEENRLDETDMPAPKVVLTNTVKDVRSTNVKYGSEVGDTCPICREGTIEEIGGCSTCTNCGAQLKCGL